MLIIIFLVIEAVTFYFIKKLVVKRLTKELKELLEM